MSSFHTSSVATYSSTPPTPRTVGPVYKPTRQRSSVVPFPRQTSNGGALADELASLSRYSGSVEEGGTSSSFSAVGRRRTSESREARTFDGSQGHPVRRSSFSGIPPPVVTRVEGFQTASSSNSGLPSPPCSPTPIQRGKGLLSRQFSQDVPCNPVFGFDEPPRSSLKATLEKFFESPAHFTHGSPRPSGLLPPSLLSDLQVVSLASFLQTPLPSLYVVPVRVLTLVGYLLGLATVLWL
jgi:hypothetical protein